LLLVGAAAWAPLASAANGTVTGTVTATGGNVNGLTVQAISSTGVVAGSSAVAAAGGAYSISLPGGTYTVKVTGEFADSDASKSVTVANDGSATADLSVKTVPYQSLNTADLTGSAWKIGINLTALDFAAGAANFDDSSWADVTVPGDVSAGNPVPDASDYAYRVAFGLPADWAGKPVVLDGFTIDDGEYAVFVNGTKVNACAEPVNGPLNPWTYQRIFYVPGNLAKASNTLTIFVHQGYGGAGIFGNVRVHPMWSTRGIISGKVTNDAGNLISTNVTLLDGTGAQVATATASGPVNGTYIFSNVAPGTYTVSVVGELVDSLEASKSVTVTGGALSTADLSVKTLPSISLTGNVLTGAGWKLGGGLTADNFSAADPAFDDSSWEAVTVPGDISAKISQDSEFAYRVKFDVPDSFVGKDLILDAFSADDGETGVFMNGTSLSLCVEPIGGPGAPWGYARTFLVPGSAVKKSNTLAIFLHQGNGGAGIFGNPPRLYPTWSTKGIVVGKLVGTDGKPVNGNIGLVNSKGKLAASTVSSGPKQGAFGFYGLAPGTYTLDTLASNYTGAPSSITVEGGKTLTLPNLVPSIAPYYEDTTQRATDDEFTGTSLDAKWQVADVGDATGGTQTVSNGILDVTAGGHNIWDQNDGFHYIYQPIKGDFIATVQVLAVPDNRDWENAGLMIRKDLDQQSPHAYSQVTPNHPFQNKLRPTRGSLSNDNTTGDPNASTLFPNIYLKLRRQGTRVAYFWTSDPKTTPIFNSVRTVPGLDTADVLVGLAACSLSAADVDPGFQFAHFKVIPLTSTPVTPAVTLGDLNGDGKVSITDVVTALRGVAGLVTLTADQQKAADVNVDGKFNITDVVLMLRYVAGLITKFPGQA
jgi:regulation of enolase protein 1 (concanavalin A-like superfamily)